MVDRQTLTQITSSTIGHITWSDHAPVDISISTQFHTASRPPWKLNLFILKNAENISFLSSQFFQLNAPSTSSPTLLWCTHKAYIRGLLIQLTAKNKKIREEKISKLLSDLQQADVAFKTNPSPQTEAALKKLRDDFRLLYLHKYDYNLAKLRWNFYLQGDRPGKLLAIGLKRFKPELRFPSC